MRNDHFSRTNRWETLPRGDVSANHARNYVSLNKKGRFVLSKKTHERLGSPTHYLIKRDKDNPLLALEPATREMKNAYPTSIVGGGGAKAIHAHRLITEWGICPPDTIEFVKPKIDADGVLILNTRNIRLSPRAHSQCRKNRRQKE